MKAHNRAARRPEFFMLGALKCGTTALASHLATHPLIQVSEPKEPNYLCKGLRRCQLAMFPIQNPRH